MARMTEEEYEKKAKEVLKGIPKVFHAELKFMAYDHGHAYGWEEILEYLRDFASGLNTPMEKLRKAIRDCENLVGSVHLPDSAKEFLE